MIDDDDDGNSRLINDDVSGDGSKNYLNNQRDKLAK